MSKKLAILGIRGIPASHGGFETFAEKLSLFLKEKQWQVTVYCQAEQGSVNEDYWHGIRRVIVPTRGNGSLASVIFDLKVAWIARKEPGVLLTLGYNTAIFNIIQRLWRQKNIINMDGIEWKRDKWGGVAKAWFWLNERIGCWVGNHLIADHPEIKKHLSTRVGGNKITMIPYGGNSVTDVDDSILSEYGLSPFYYAIIIARPEPENSFLQIVRAFSSKPRDHKLVVLGKFDYENNEYHRKVIDAAGENVVFLGAIYDENIVGSLRKYASFYVHGHTVGGTNPSLVEALGAGCAIIAHDNKFNRWVAGEGQIYFKNEDNLDDIFSGYLNDKEIREKMKKLSEDNFEKRFQWDMILKQYEDLLVKYI